MEVIKRKGEKSKLDAEKINRVLMWATENISGVSPSDVAMNAHIQFYQGIKTTEIHNTHTWLLSLLRHSARTHTTVNICHRTSLL